MTVSILENGCSKKKIEKIIWKIGANMASSLLPLRTTNVATHIYTRGTNQ